MENEVKEPAPKYNYISPEEYLALDRASEEKNEYYDGHVHAMSGASLAHNDIAANLYAAIGTYLKGKNCRILPSDMRVSTPNRDTYIYPDATIVYGEARLEGDKSDTLLNPSVVFEILSLSTQKNDYGYKFLYYNNIPSIQEYIMIDSKRRFAQVARRQKDLAWKMENFSNPQTIVHIQAIDFSISFDDIYYNTRL